MQGISQGAIPNCQLLLLLKSLKPNVIYKMMHVHPVFVQSKWASASSSGVPENPGLK